MADQKISAMPSAATLTGNELVPLVQGGVNVQTTIGAVRSLGSSYGAFSDSTDQTGSVTQGTAVKFNTVDVADSVTIATQTKITVPEDGIYNLQFSLQFKNTDNAQQDATVWLKINNVDVTNSSTQYTVPARKSANIYGYNVSSLTFMLDLNANDFVQIYWIPTSLTVTVEALPASVSPAYPAVPSAIACMFRVA